MKNFILCLIPLAASLHAGEKVPSQIPRIRQWMLHADFDAMRGCETGKAVFQRIEADQGAQRRTFQRMFSLHLINDVHDVTLFGDGKPEHAVLLISRLLVAASVIESPIGRMGGVDFACDELVTRPEVRCSVGECCNVQQAGGDSANFLWKLKSQQTAFHRMQTALR